MIDISGQDLLDEAERTYRAIGRFMFEFSQTEYTLRSALGEEVLKDSKRHFAVVEVLDAVTLCNVAKQVFRASRADEAASRIETEINRFLALNQERVRVAHGLWIPYFKGGMVRHVSRSSLKAVVHPGQAEALEKLGVEAGEIRTRLHAAVLALPEPKSIPGTP
jgi:hypothetical protein